MARENGSAVQERRLPKVRTSDHESQVQAQQEALLHTLAELGGKLTAEEEVVFEGKRLVLPESMDLTDAIDFLKQKRDEDESVMTFERTYQYRPWDGARALMRALKQAFGMVSQKGVPHWWGVEPPSLITIPIGPNGQTDQVPWGGLAVPLMPGATMYVGQTNHRELGPLFHINVESPRKYRFQIEGIFRLVAEELKKESLYRGKAFDGQVQPEFLDLRGVDPSKVIYSEDVVVQLEANLWSLMRFTPAMRSHGVPLKRAVLFEGPYGTGKTLGAYLTAKIAQENGWTFIMCRPGRDELKNVMGTARLYQPCVVFFEDVDVVAGSAGNGESGKDHVAELLDIFDGINAKGTEILAVLTTNHVEHIHKGMLRPGRLDAVIEIGALDTAAVEKMAKATIPDHMLSEDIDWMKVGDSMAGFLPAFVREALDRTVRYNLSRNGGEPTMLATDDFVFSGDGLRRQLQLMEDAKETGQKPSLDAAFETIIEEVQKRSFDDTVIRHIGHDEPLLEFADR